MCREGLVLSFSPISKSDAKAAGLTRYCTGRPCLHGHFSERYVSTGGCVECLNARSASPEGRERSRKSKQKHRTKYAKYNREWSKSNRDRFCEYSRSYAIRNRSKVLERYKKRHRENPEQNREWVARYRARKGLATPAWANRASILQIYRLASLATAATGVPHEVDHFVPLHGGNVCGLHVSENLLVVPWWENREKSNKFQMPQLGPS